MSWKFPSDPIEYLDVGFSHGLVYSSCHIIPFEGKRLKNHGVEIIPLSIPFLGRRNPRGYAYHHTSTNVFHSTFDEHVKSKRPYFEQERYYDNHYHDSIPSSVLLPALAQEERENVFERQGNDLLGIELRNQRQILLHSYGEIRQKLSYFEVPDEEKDGNKEEKLSTMSLETGSTIQQLERMGPGSHQCIEGEADHPLIVVRGAATGTIVQIQEIGSSGFQLQEIYTVKTPALLRHIAGSPHTNDELACITIDGHLHHWTSDETIVKYDASNERANLVCCEYTAHPSVLWSCTATAIWNVDFRQPDVFGSQSRYDVNTVAAGSDAVIHGIQRHPINPYQIMVNSSASIQVMDSRWNGNAVHIAWKREHIHEYRTKTSTTGPMAVLSVNTPDVERTLICTSNAAQLSTMVRGFSSGGSDSDTILLNSLLQPENLSTPVVEPYQAFGAPLELHIPDRLSGLQLTGVAAFAKTTGREWKAMIFHSTSLGDIYYQRISPRGCNPLLSQNTAQMRLPVGMTVAADRTETTTFELPAPSMAYIQENDAEALGTITEINVPSLLASNLKPKKYLVEIFSDLKACAHLNEQKKKVLTILRPTASVFFWHHQVQLFFAAQISTSIFLKTIREWSDLTYHITKVDASHGSYTIHPLKERDCTSCTCKQATLSSIPCSSTCILYHIIIVTKKSLDVNSNTDPTINTDEIPDHQQALCASLSDLQDYHDVI